MQNCSRISRALVRAKRRAEAATAFRPTTRSETPAKAGVQGRVALRSIAGSTCGNAWQTSAKKPRRRTACNANGFQRALEFRRGKSGSSVPESREQVRLKHSEEPALHSGSSNRLETPRGTAAAFRPAKRSETPAEAGVQGASSCTESPAPRGRMRGKPAPNDRCAELPATPMDSSLRWNFAGRGLGSGGPVSRELVRARHREEPRLHSDPTKPETPAEAGVQGGVPVHGIDGSTCRGARQTSAK